MVKIIKFWLYLEATTLRKGRNEAIVKKSEELYGYVRFVGKVREYQKAGLDLETAITRAINDCIKEGILSDFLKTHSSEVINMLTAEWDIDIAIKVREEEAREEEKFETVIGMKKEGLADDVIARVTKLPIEKIREIHS